MTDLGENYVQMRTEIKKKKKTEKRSSPQISGVFGRFVVLHLNPLVSTHTKT